MDKKTKKFVMIGSVASLVFIAVIFFFTDFLQKEDDRFMGKRNAPGSGFQRYSSEDAERYANDETDISYEKLLEDYVEWSQYPPDSRPLKPGYLDQIGYYWIPVYPRKMLIPNEKDDEEPTYRHECVLQPLKKDVTEGEKMVVELRCYRSDPEDDQSSETLPVSAKIKDFTLERSFDRRRWNIPKNTIKKAVSDRKKNQYAYRWEYIPRRSDWGDMRFNVSFLLPAEEKDKYVSHEMFADFFSSPVAPAIFTGNVRDVVEDGSLIIYVELNVKITGDYTIEANLYNEDGPVAYARTPRDKKATFDTKGIHEARLEFFGKVFHDQDAEGPYKVVGLRGVQNNLPISASELDSLSIEEVEQKLATTVSREPDRRVIPTLTSEHTTEPYVLDDFSEKDYESERKQEKINYYKDQLKRLQESE